MKQIITIGALLFSGLLPGLVRAQVDWVEYENNPVIDEAFDPGSTVIFRPSVVFDGTTYHMWYGKEEGGLAEVMGYATSTDGRAWTLVESVVLQPSLDPARFDRDSASQGWVIADGDTLKMWYWGNGQNVGNIGYAWSLDGITWIKVDGAGLDGSVYDRVIDGGSALALATPTVVKDQGGTYHMWFSRVIGLDGVFIGRIGYATSPDGLIWTNVPGPGTDGAVLDWGAAGSFDDFTVLWPAVVETEGGFMMWYAGGGPQGQTGGLGCATSPDGVTWTKIAGNATNGACFETPGQVAVIEQEGQYKMWYGIGGTTRSNDVVHLAFSGEPPPPQNQAPPAPQITTPEDQAEIVVGGGMGEAPLPPETPFAVTWTESIDPDGDTVSYTWQLATAGDFTEGTVLLSAETGTETRFETTLGALAALLDQNSITPGLSLTLFHRVVASDGEFDTPSATAQVTLFRGTLVANEAEALPVSYALDQNYPNPFATTTHIRFALPSAGPVTLTVYNLMGQEIAVLVSGTYPAGRYTTTWDAADLASGVYTYRLQAGAYSETRALLVLK